MQLVPDRAGEAAGRLAERHVPRHHLRRLGRRRPIPTRCSPGRCYKRKGHAPDERLNGLIERHRRTVDPEQRRALLQEFGRYVHEQAYWLFIHAQDEFYAKRKDVPWQLAPSHSFGQMRYWYTPGP